jgi:adenine-specific DNA-methyltransferase
LGKSVLNPNFEKLTEQSLNRRLRDLREVVSYLKTHKMPPLQMCKTILEGRYLGAKIRAFFVGLPDEEKHYWISSLYALLMPQSKRQKLAAYFTPPHLAEYVLDLIEDSGIVVGKDNILDPASGGAAFLVPLAKRIIAKSRKKNKSAAEIVRSIETTLCGIEIEPDLAALSEILITDLLKDELSKVKRPLKLTITAADTLKSEPPKHLLNAVVGNPPYGRVFQPKKMILKEFQNILSDNYVNLYALFVEQSIRWTKPGGRICLIIPTSFIGGPYFAALRKRILQSCVVERLDLIDKRSDVFVDVVQDVCVLLLRKKIKNESSNNAKCSSIKIDGTAEPLGIIDLPSTASDRIWGLPNERDNNRLFQEGLVALADYGYITKTGYFVWNREKERFRLGSKPYKKEVPLYWAHNVRANKICLPLEDQTKKDKIGFVSFDRGRNAVITSDAIILQRTSNRRQARRVIAGLIYQSDVLGKNGFISENHTILILPNAEKPQRVSMEVLCRLLNTSAVDERFRRISGSVSLSTKALRALPLPTADSVNLLFKKTNNDEGAAKLAYAKSISDAQIIKMQQTKTILTQKKNIKR